MAEHPADLHNVEAQVDNQVAREGVAQVVEAQANGAVFEPSKMSGAVQGQSLDVALAERRSAASGEYPIATRR